MRTIKHKWAPTSQQGRLIKPNRIGGQKDSAHNPTEVTPTDDALKISKTQYIPNRVRRRRISYQIAVPKRVLDGGKLNNKKHLNHHNNSHGERYRS